MHVLLVDGSTYIFRAYHALPPLTRKSDGLPLGAVSGFCNMLFKLTQDFSSVFDNNDKPTHMAVVFDHSGRSFRNDFYPDYKAHRPPAPEDLIPQFPLTRAATKAFNIASVEQEGFEADDLIATYTSHALAQGAKVTIVSSDKDLMQLIDGDVHMLDTMKNRWIGYDEVVEKFGLGPEKVIDIQALAGDSVDNVPGVPGIGIKTAAQLIEEFGDLDALLAGAHTIKQKKRRENLIEFSEQARVSRDLVTLKQDVPVEMALESFALEPLRADKIFSFLNAMELRTISKRIGALLEADPADFAADTDLAAKNEPAQALSAQDKSTPQTLFDKIVNEMKNCKVNVDEYECIRELEAVDAWVEAIQSQGFVALDTETTGLDNQAADLVGISLAIAPNKACYIPLGHQEGEGDLLGGGKATDQLEIDDVITRLKPVFEDPSVLKIGQNLKYDMGILARYDTDLTPIDDTMLMAYAADGAGGNGMDDLSTNWLNHTPISFSSLAGTGKNQRTFDQINIEDATQYAAEDADITLRLHKVLRQRLMVKKANQLYQTIERPLAPVLARMEARGILVDRQKLSQLSGDFAQRAAALEAEIHELAGSSFNVGSPKQLGEILFERLALPGGKKTKTGAWATGVGVLEELAAQGHKLPQKVIQWRGLTKLKSTYTDALPHFINQHTGRVHTSYAQAAVITGRLSSSDPNLQNIPIRTEDGRKIRRAFVADKGYKLISADYSQIELRVLAHIAQIGSLIKAFEDGLDIHAMTASEMFNVPIKGMDPTIRRKAKAINFGIIYGISAFGLANQLGIGRNEAKEYIDTYFKRFPGIQDYMEAQKTFAHEHGYVETIFGRKCYYPDINTKNQAKRGFYERAAINAPIQGSAADIIRRAMIKMEPALIEAGLSTNMLLQVHDELIFEVPETEIEATVKVIVRTMERAPLPHTMLAVPLKVDAHAAHNWDEAH